MSSVLVARMISFAATSSSLMGHLDQPFQIWQQPLNCELVRTLVDQSPPCGTGNPALIPLT